MITHSSFRIWSICLNNALSFLKLYLEILFLSKVFLYLYSACYQTSFPIIKRLYGKIYSGVRRKESRYQKGRMNLDMNHENDPFFWFYCLPHNSNFIATIFATSTPFLWFNEQFIWTTDDYCHRFQRSYLLHIYIQ